MKERITTRWGDLYYSDTRLGMLFDEFKDMKAQTFTDLISWLFKKSALQPLIPDFRDARKALPADGPPTKTLHSGPSAVDKSLQNECSDLYYQCVHCKDRGRIYVAYRDPKYELYTAMFKCFCAKGKAIRARIPEWNMRLESKFRVLEW